MLQPRGGAAMTCHEHGVIGEHSCFTTHEFHRLRSPAGSGTTGLERSPDLGSGGPQHIVLACRGGATATTWPVAKATPAEQRDDVALLRRRGRYEQTVASRANAATTG